MKNTLRKLIQISCVTNIFEWYEFTVYSFMALSIGYNFFASKSPIFAILQSLAVFSISYLIRPIGGIFFGYLGEKYSSQVAFKYSMIIMAIPTIIMGLLPTYNQVGIISPVTLIVLRLIQGFAAGGELPSCATYLYKQSDKSINKVFLCGLINIGGMIGVLMASGIVSLIYLFTSTQVIQSWAWRIPFLLAFPLSVIIIESRNKLSVVINNDSINKLVQYQDNKIPICKIIKAILIISFLQVSFYLIFVWMPIYLENFLHISPHIARLSNVISLICLVICTIVCSYLANFINYKKLISFSVISSFLLSYYLFYLINNSSIIFIMIIQILFVIIISPIQGCYLFALGNMFKYDKINICMSLSYTIPTALFGGTASFICSYFIHISHNNIFPGIYLTLFSLLAIPAVYLL